MLDVVSVEVITECGRDVSVDVEFLDELVEDGDLLLLCCGLGWAVACCGHKGEEGEKDVKLHSGGW